MKGNILRGMKSLMLGLLVSVWGLLSAGAEPMRVTALHPLMADLARQVGGARVEVFDLVGEGGNPHRFEPRPADMKRLQASAVVLAAGKNLEPYLGRLKESLEGVTVVETGITIPSLTVGKDEIYGEDPHHHHGDGTVDPHWWQSVDNMRRAARVVAQALAARDPEGKDTYMKNAEAYGQHLEALKKWAKSELSKVPRDQRKLVTAHNAFAYFAKEFGFEVIAVAGLNQEQNTTPQEQARTIEAVKKAGVRAIFPETNTGGKAVDALSAATGVHLATPLISDGNGTGKDAGFEGMIRHNVTAITQALGGQ